MKTEFELDCHKADLTGSNIRIIGKHPKNKPYVSINLPDDKGSLFILDKDIERFAVNILKSINSKHIKK